MADYKQMYSDLYNSVENAIKMLQLGQSNAEESSVILDKSMKNKEGEVVTYPKKAD